MKKGEAEEPFADGTEPAIPLERQISHKYQTLITPSEQVEELRGGMAASEAVEGYLGKTQHFFLILFLLDIRAAFGQSSDWQAQSLFCNMSILNIKRRLHRIVFQKQDRVC